MPKSLEELRAELNQRYLNRQRAIEEGEVPNGDDVPSAPEESQGINLDPEQMRALGSRYQFIVNKHGVITDARLLFGKHNGMLISDISSQFPGYLKWMMESDFPDSIKTLVNIHIRK